MKVLLQRVNSASVSSEGIILGKIGRGLLLFLGISKEDTEGDIFPLIEKILNLRVFPNDAQKFDYSVLDISAEVLVVSQFTLYGDCRKGRRPDFTSAAHPGDAEVLYNKFVQALKDKIGKIETGEFGAYMQVKLENDGPVTFLLESPKKN